MCGSSSKKILKKLVGKVDISYLPLGTAGFAKQKETQPSFCLWFPRGLDKSDPHQKTQKIKSGAFSPPRSAALIKSPAMLGCVIGKHGS